MRNTSINRGKKFFRIVILSIFVLVAVVLAMNLGEGIAYAHEPEIECFDNSDYEHSSEVKVSNINGNIVLDQAYLSVHYADGTMGMVIDETYDPDEIIFEPFSFTHLQRSTVRSSGKPDNESIVVVFLGDGFTTSEQQTFLDKVTEISNYMITVAPFDLYKEYLTVYAAHSISNESGVSGEVGGVFACRDLSGNPSTPQCTPVDSSVFNCTHGKDTFYNSYYQWRSSANRVILEMSSADRTRARNHALAASSSAKMVQVIANSAMRGGTGQMPTSSQPLGVALTSINHANLSGDWKEVTMHEFGHTFGGLWDEYWNGLTFSNEWPNITNNSSTTTGKWSHWVGKRNVGVFPFAASDWDGNPNQATNPWFRPHQNCMMRQTSYPFCAVCEQTLLTKMALATGITAYTTTNLSGDNIRIDGFNLEYIGRLVIPTYLNGRTVTRIENDVFASQGQLTHITIPESVTNLNNNTFHNNTNVYWLDNYAFRDNIFLKLLSNPTEFTIPDIIAGKTVTQIENYAFAGSTTLTKVTIPSSVAYIGDHAFSNCTSLSQVEISDETTSILGSTPFSGCTQLYGTILSIKTDYHRIIDGTGRLIWMAHDFVYDNHHSSTHHDLVCQSCGHEDTKTHNKQVVNGIEVCYTCPWVGDVHTNHEHTHAYIPIPHSGKFPVNKHKAYCYCGLYIEEMCLGRIAEDGKAYCIYCGRDMTGALGPILNKMLLPESELHDHDIYCIEDYHLDNCCTIKNEIYSSEPNNVLYMDVKRRERSFYDRISYKGR